MDQRDVVDTIRGELRARGTTPFRAAVDAKLPGTAIRHILEGKQPRLGRLIEVCEALGLELHVGPSRPENWKNESESSRSTPGVEADPNTETRKNEPDFSSSEGMTRFSEVELPVMGWAKCALAGHHELTEEQTLPELPMPEAMDTFEDGGIFYAIAKGSSMIPEGIEEGDYCLVSPATRLSVGLRVWVKDRQKRSMIKRLVAEDDKTYTLRGWQEPDASGRQTDYRDQWMKPNIAASGVVLAAYRGKPDVKKPPELIPDPKPPASLAPAELIEALEFPAGTTLAEAIGEIEARSDFDPGAKLQEMAGMLDELASQAKQQAERLPDVIPISPGMGDLLREYYDFVPRYSSDSVRLAAGIDSVVDQEDLAGHVAFRKTWLGSNGLRAKNLSLVDVMGDSMEPKLLDGDSVLVNHASRDPIEGRVFAISTGDGPLVKRLRQEGGRWWAHSDNPNYKPRTLGEDAGVIGRVVWTAHTPAEWE